MNPDYETGTMTTWRRADGEPINMYDFVLQEEYFEMDSEPTELVREVWVRTSSERVTIPEPIEQEDE